MSGANPKYRHTYSTDIHYLVKYKCCSCGALNTDTSQISTVKIRKTGDDGIDLVREDAEAEQELRQAVEAAVKGKRHCIENRSYEALDLKCRCSVCGSRQPWSCFWPVWGFLGGLFSRIRGLGAAEHFYFRFRWRHRHDSAVYRRRHAGESQSRHASGV